MMQSWILDTHTSPCVLIVTLSCTSGIINPWQVKYPPRSPMITPNAPPPSIGSISVNKQTSTTPFRLCHPPFWMFVILYMLGTGNNGYDKNEAVFIIKTWIRGHQTLMEKLPFFDPTYIIRPSSTHFPGVNADIIYLRTNQNSILFYFNPSVMQNRGGKWMQDKGDNQQEVLSEINSDLLRVSVLISKIFQIWIGR